MIQYPQNLWIKLESIVFLYSNQWSSEGEPCVGYIQLEDVCSLGMQPVRYAV